MISEFLLRCSVGEHLYHSMFRFLVWKTNGVSFFSGRSLAFPVCRFGVIRLSIAGHDALAPEGGVNDCQKLSKAAFHSTSAIMSVTGQLRCIPSHRLRLGLSADFSVTRNHTASIWLRAVSFTAARSWVSTRCEYLSEGTLANSEPSRC